MEDLAYKIGSVLGRIQLGVEVAQRSQVLAQQVYEQKLAEEFSGDAVEDILVPTWLPVDALVPVDELRSLGLAPAHGAAPTLLATAGVDPHVDHMAGLSYCIVLANDSLTFRQAGQRHATRPGEYFVFDDSRTHEVRESARSTVYLCLTLALRRI